MSLLLALELEVMLVGSKSELRELVILDVGNIPVDCVLEMSELDGISPVLLSEVNVGCTDDRVLERMSDDKELRSLVIDVINEDGVEDRSDDEAPISLDVNVGRLVIDEDMNMPEVLSVELRSRLLDVEVDTPPSEDVVRMLEETSEVIRIPEVEVGISRDDDVKKPEEELSVELIMLLVSEVSGTDNVVESTPEELDVESPPSLLEVTIDKVLDVGRSEAEELKSISLLNEDVGAVNDVGRVLEPSKIVELRPLVLSEELTPGNDETKLDD